MIVRRLAARRLVKRGSTEEEPRRKRAARFLLVILTAGLIAGTAAWLDIWPFGNIHSLVVEVLGSTKPNELPAQRIYPTVPPLQKTVDVYASPAPVRAQPTAAPTSQPTQSPRPHPSPTPHGSPTPHASPSPDD